MYLSSFPSFPIFRFNVQNRRFTTSPSSARVVLIKRLRDSGLAELTIAVVAAFPVFLFFDYEWVSNQISAWHGSASEGLSPAGWWFTCISSPIIRFFQLRWVWRYGLWSALLNKIAKLNLDLRPTHLDLLGGLGIVRFAQRHFGILFAALGAFVAGQYANSITYFGLPIKDSMAPMVVFVVISVLVVLGPLTLFSPKLADAKRNGLAQYSQLARRLTASFDSKWLNETDANAFALSPARQAGGNFLSFFALPPWPVNFRGPAKECSVASPYWGYITELMEVVALAQTGKIKMLVEHFPLAQATEAYHLLHGGKIQGRAVVVPNG